MQSRISLGLAAAVRGLVRPSVVDPFAGLCVRKGFVSQAAAPSGTLTTIFVAFILAAIIILPSLGLLYVLDQKSLLEPGELTATSHSASPSNAPLSQG
jgi:hypothetical protein